MPDFNFAERFILSRVCIGLSYQEIMGQHQIPFEVLQEHLREIYRKTETQSNYQLKLWALQNQKEIFGYELLGKGVSHV